MNATEMTTEVWVGQQLARRGRYLRLREARLAAGQPVSLAEVDESAAMGKSMRLRMKGYEASVTPRGRGAFSAVTEVLDLQDSLECKLRDCAVPTVSTSPRRPLTAKARPYQDRFAESGLWEAIGRRQSILSWIAAKIARGDDVTGQERHNAGIARKALDVDAAEVSLDAEWQARLDRLLAELDKREAELAVTLDAGR